ncbi:MAG: DUF898 family protein [Betaproteobacteria bacterium]|nr:MAG: DUF898 family protein [Betaproteobacteria bacterium]
MAFWKNPFDGPPPIPRAPLPSEDPFFVRDEALRTAEVDVDAVPHDRLDRKATQRDLTLEFTGDTWEYFRLWAATQALIFVTLGLYAPWAKVRRTRYLARHYRLDGVGFEYRANPVAILRGKLLVYAVLAIGAMLAFLNPFLIAPMVLVVYLPLAWLLTHSFRFRWQTIRYRNIAFGFRPDAKVVRWPVLAMGVVTATLFLLQTTTDQKTLPAALVLLLASLALGLLAWPYLTSKLLHHRFANARWGATELRLDCTVREIFKMMFKGGKGFFIGIVVAFSVLNALTVLIKNIDLRSIAQALSYLLLTVCAVAFGRTRRLNYALNRLSVGDQITFISTMEPDRAAGRALRYGLASVLTLGLAIPWATIDFARWRTQNLLVRLTGDWSDFPTNPPTVAAKGAIADGLAEEFGIEVGW